MLAYVISMVLAFPPPSSQQLFERAAAARNYGKCDLQIVTNDPLRNAAFRTRAAGKQLINEYGLSVSLHYNEKIWQRNCDRTEPDDSQPHGVFVYDPGTASDVIKGYDLRFLGIGQQLWHTGRPEELYSSAGLLETTVEPVEGASQYRATLRYFDRTEVYCFDSAKGGSQVRRDRIWDNGDSEVVEIVHQEYDGYWYPASIRCTRNGKLVSTTVTSFAVIENERLPIAFSPRDIGVGLETNVRRMIRTSEGKTRIGPLRGFDGLRIVPFATAWQMLESGQHDDLKARSYTFLPYTQKR